MSTINLSSTANSTAIAGSNDVINGAASDTLYLQGSSDTLNLVQGEAVNIQSGNNDVINLTGGAANVAANVADTTLNGSATWINASSGDTIYASGYYDGLILANGDVADIVSGGYDVVSLSSGVLDIAANEYANTLSGSADVANVQSGNTIAVTGNSDTLNLANGDAANLYGNANLVNLSGGAINIAANIYNTSLDGSSTWVDALSGDTVYTSGYYDGFVMANGDTVDVLSGGYDLVSLSSGTLDLSANEYVTTLSGSNDVVNAGGADSVDLTSGGGNTVSLSNGAVNISTGAVYESVIGSADAINVLACSDTVGIAGSNNTVQLSSNGAVDLTSGGGNTVSLSNGTVNISAGAVYDSVIGSADSVNVLASSDTVGIAGSNNTVQLSSNGAVDLTSGGCNTVSLGNGTVNISAAAVYESVIGSADSINVLAGSDTIGIAGSNNTVGFISNGTADLTTGGGNTVSLSNGGVNISAGAVYESVIGSADTINVLAGSDTVGIAGSNNTINFNSNNGAADITSGVGNIVSLSNGAVNLSSNSGGNLYGSNDVVVGSTGDGVNATGNNNNISIGSGGFVGVASSTGDSVTMNGSTLAVGSNVSGLVLNGSNDVVVGLSGSGPIPANESLTVNGSNEVVNVTTGDTVFLSAGDAGNTINSTANSSDDSTINPVAGISFNVNGGNNFINASNITNDTINVGTSTSVVISGGGDTFNVAANSSLDLWGNNNSVIEASGNAAFSSGNDNNFNIGGGSWLALGGSAGDTVAMSGDSLLLESNVTGLVLNGSNDDVIGASWTGPIAANDSLTVNGNNNVVNVTTGDNVIFAAGDTGDAIALAGVTIGINSAVQTDISLTSASYLSLIPSNYAAILASYGANYLTNYMSVTSAGATVVGTGLTLSAGAGVTLTVTGANDVVTAAAGDVVALNGTYDTLSMTNGGTVSVRGTEDVVDQSNGILNLGASSSAVLNGSNDVVNVGAYSAIALNGSNTTINAKEGDIIILNAGDSGDVINMFGGTVVVNSKAVSNITINGTGNTITGPGSTTFLNTISIPLQYQEPGGPTSIVSTTTSYVGVTYSAASVSELITYFEANPNLSQSQIAADESDPGYQASLENYFNSAQIYNNNSFNSGLPNDNVSNSLTPNLLAMLDGYSEFDVAFSGINPSIFSEEAYIEQQFESVTSAYPTMFPTSGLESLLPAILPDLNSLVTSGNTIVQNDVTIALNLLAAGNAATPQGNQGPLLDDSLAALYLEAAMNPTTTSFVDEVDPNRSGGHWDIILYQPSPGTFSVVETYKAQPLITTVLEDFNTYVAPVVDLLAVISLNPELIPLIEAVGVGATAVEVIGIAADVVSTVQIGEDFATGNYLAGALAVLGQVGGALQAIGGSIDGVDGGMSIETEIGDALTVGVQVAQGMYSIATSTTPLGAIIGALNTAGVLAGAATLSTAQEFAEVGSGLASVIQAGETGNYIGALTSLVQTVNDVPQSQLNIQQDLNTMYDAFMLDVYDPVAGAVSWLWQATTSEVNSLEQFFEKLGSNPQAVNSLTNVPPTQAQQYLPALLAGYAAGQNATTSGDIQLADNSLVASDVGPGNGSMANTQSYTDKAGVIFTPTTIKQYIIEANDPDPWNAEDSPLYAALYPSSSDPKYHEYSDMDLIGTTEDGLTVQMVYNMLKFYAAPGQVGEASTDDIQFVPGDNPVTQIVNDNNYSVENVTLPGHILDPGNVVRQVVQVGDSIYISTVGTGTGNFKTLNDIVGSGIIFPELDNTIRTNLQPLTEPIIAPPY